MTEQASKETASVATARMMQETLDEIGHGYSQPHDFTGDEILELQRLAALAWTRMESRDLEQIVAEFTRRNSADTPKTETYAELYSWHLQQTARYPVWFGQPIPAAAVFWAYGKAALTSADFVNSPERIKSELHRFISGSDEFANVIYDDVQPYDDREPWRG